MLRNQVGDSRRTARSATAVFLATVTERTSSQSLRQRSTRLLPALGSTPPPAGYTKSSLTPSEGDRRPEGGGAVQLPMLSSLARPRDGGGQRARRPGHLGHTVEGLFGNRV